MSADEALVWTRDFIVIDAEAPAGPVLARVRASRRSWVLIRGGPVLFAFTREELLAHPRLAGLLQKGAAVDTLPLEVVLGLQEQHQSLQTRLPQVPAYNAWRTRSTGAPSALRMVAVDAAGRAQAIGSTDVQRGATRGVTAPLQTETAPPDLRGLGASGSSAPTSAPALALPPDDEGTSPRRFPSIEADGALKAGEAMALVVDLLRKPSAETLGGELAIAGLAPDWTELSIDVTVSSPGIAFDDGGRGMVTMRRNAASVPARIGGRVLAGLADGNALAVSAQFMYGTRLSGVALRLLKVGSPASVGPPAAAVPTDAGVVLVDRAALAPDVTVYIAVADPARPQELRWQITTPRFDGLPAALDGLTLLDEQPRVEAAALFKEFAALPAGQHRASIEGFGDRLWDRAPAQWREVYWALWDHYLRSLTIQFVSDDPYMPWELMRPARPDESETHQPLALMHAVGRWIRRWDGYMPNRLPYGRLCTVAPHYRISTLKLARAEAESKMLQDDYGAERVDGTCAAFKALLESTPAAPVALLHFSGHGSFAADAVGTSSIKLEDGVFTVAEAARREVRLGQACRTLVIFNACEVGATASSLGAVGGWADALLGRHFGGFIAPLWAVEDEDAAKAVAEMIDGIVRLRLPIGAVLRDMRAKYGDLSPTFFSYLYYGDVTARISAIAPPPRDG